MAYDLQALKRAIVVGEVTKGGANPGRWVHLDEHFACLIPTGRAVNPITGTNWEGVGVHPDVEVSADLALKTAELLAMKLLLKNITDDEERDLAEQAVSKLEAELIKVGP